MLNYSSIMKKNNENKLKDKTKYWKKIFFLKKETHSDINNGS